MKFQITLLLCFFMFGLATSNEAFAAVGNNVAVEINSKDEAKKAKKMARLEKRLDKMAKMVNKATGISEAKYKEMSTGAKVALIVSASLIFAIGIFLLIWLVILKPLWTID